MIVAVIDGGRADEGRDWAAELRSSALWARQRAALYLEEHPTEALRAAGALAECLGDPDPRVRRVAAEALAHVGGPAVDVLLVSLGHRSYVAREWSAALLGRLGAVAGRAVDVLEAATLDPEWTVRIAAQAALKRIRGQA